MDDYSIHPKVNQAMTEKILDVELKLLKETEGTFQYGTPKNERPQGVRVLMLDKWLFDGTDNPKPHTVHIVVTEAN